MPGCSPGKNAVCNYSYSHLRLRPKELLYRKAEHDPPLS
nr:MAG TPA: hypothetical protein [Caudoviricetes sp.]